MRLTSTFFRAGFGLVAILWIGSPVASASSGSASQDAAPARPLVLSRLILIDGTGAPAREGVSIVIEGERITQITDGLPESLPAGAEVVDVSGKFAVPGLIETHSHLVTDPSGEDFEPRFEAKLRWFLGHGICDVRDMAGDGRVLADAARRTAAGELPGPNIHFAAMLAGPGYFGDPRIQASSRGVEVGTAPWAHAVTDETDLAQLMREIDTFGATGVKLYAELGPELSGAIVAAALEQGLRVWSHWVIAPRETHAFDAVQFGVQVVSHAYMLMYDASPEQRKSWSETLAASGGTELLAEMAERGTILDATLSAALNMRLPPGSDWATPLEVGAEIVKAARAAGVLVATGSDHPGDGTRPGLHTELGLLVEHAELEPLEVLEATTRISAMALGIEAERGTLEVGKFATLLLLDQDPSWSVAPLAEPTYVIQRGVLYSGANLRDAEAPVEVLETLAD